MAEETEINQALACRVYYMAREGMPLTLYALLSDKTQEQIDAIINQTIYEDKGHKCTPLIIAARYGHDKVVKMMCEKFKLNLEQEGIIKIDGSIVESVTALWCAAAAGHLNVVKTLVDAGADVNHSTSTNSTPLRAACFDGRLDIVTYLMKHNADIHIANKYDNTCLMIAAHKGHLDIVTFLLENGADPNKKGLCGETALHFAAEWGHRKIIIELLRHGAKITKNNCGMTPLISAAERIRYDAVICLMQQNLFTKEEIIDAYELLGASYANDKDYYCPPMAYLYLYTGMKLRYSNPQHIIPKRLNSPIPAYDNWRESETLERLDSIKLDLDAIHMESLTIRERILGVHNPEVPHPIIYRGAVFADHARFDRCIELWLRALQLKQANNICVVKDFLRFAQVFSQMIHVGVDLHLTQVINVLECIVIELGRNKSRVNNHMAIDDMEQYFDEMESNITSTLYILTIMVKLLALNRKSFSEDDIAAADHLVYKLCLLKLSLRDGQTLLHLAVNAKTPVDDFHTKDVCKFPCFATAKLLIRCGADVNAMDIERNTPLHIIVTYAKPIEDFMTLHSIISELIDAGAHVDTVNSQGKTPYDAATTRISEIILRTKRTMSLQCMAAKAVKTYGLSYVGNVPQSLERFIELHGSGLDQG